MIIIYFGRDQENEKWGISQSIFLHPDFQNFFIFLFSQNTFGK
jgi:hypothetical protein